MEKARKISWDFLEYKECMINLTIRVVIMVGAGVQASGTQLSENISISNVGLGLDTFTYIYTEYAKKVLNLRFLA